MSVIVPAKNAQPTVLALVNALRAQDLNLPYEVIVVDDGSTDDTAQIVEAAGRPFALIRQQGSKGAGAARNLGARNATGRILAFTDADCAPTESWLAEGLRAVADADLVQGAVLPDPSAVGTSPYERSLSVTSERGFYETANIFVTRQLFADLGGFEDWLPAVGGRPQGEDTLFGWTARRNGAKTVFAPKALVYHAVFPQSRREWVLDRWRWQVLPALVERVPELRTHTLYRRWFFEHRTATFDIGFAGLLAAFALRRRFPAVFALRYISLVVEEASRLPSRESLPYALTRTVADTVSFVALLKGSIGARTVVL